MNQRSISLALFTALALLGTGHTVAADQAAPAPKAAAQAKAAPPAARPKLVDINSASRNELMALPGIGGAEADRIIAARPYPSKAKLVADKVLSFEAYAALKGRIIAMQKAPPKAPPKAKT